MSDLTIPTTTAAGALIEQQGMTAEKVEVVARTVARGATLNELAMYFSLAKKYDLDPFAREIWCICEMNADGSRRTKDGAPIPATITVARDGFLAIANRHPAYDGMISDVVRAKDTFQVKRTKEHPDGILEEHSYGIDRGPVVGAYALVFRTDRRVPAYFYAAWSEYGEPNAKQSWSPWNKYPSAMIKKVAEAVTLKQAFSVSGVVAMEELDAGRAIDAGEESSIPPHQPLRTPQASQIGRALTAPPASPAEAFREAATASALASPKEPVAADPPAVVAEPVEPSAATAEEATCTCPNPDGLDLDPDCPEHGWDQSDAIPE